MIFALTRRGMAVRESTWEFIDLSDVPTEIGLGRLIATIDQFTSCRADDRSWDAFFKEMEKFKSGMLDHVTIEEQQTPFFKFDPFVDDRHFASSGLKILRAIADVSSHYRRRSLRTSPRLAYLLGDFENWSTANLPKLEQSVWRISSSPDVKALNTMKPSNAADLGSLVARLNNLNTVLRGQKQGEIRDFCAKNERFVSALSHYVDESTASFLDFEDDDSVVSIAKLVEPKVKMIRDEAFALSKSYETIHVVHILLLELERHMMDSLTVMKRLQWLRPK